MVKGGEKRGRWRGGFIGVVYGNEGVRENRVWGFGFWGLT